MGAAIVAEFSDIPEGFEVKESFSDIPEGFSVDATSLGKQDIQSPRKTLSEQIFKGLRTVGGLREAIPTTIANIGTTAVSGIAGIGAAALQGLNIASNVTTTGRELPEELKDPFPNIDPAKVVETIQEKGFIEPTTQAGRDATQAIAKTVEGVGKAIKFPLAAVPLIIGGKQEAKEFLDIPIGDYLGELAQDNGASPLFATLAHLSPDILLTVSAVGIAGKAKLAKPTKVKPPSIEELKAQSSALYDLVDNAGMTIADESVKTAFNSMVKFAESQGLRQKLTPKTHAALEEVAKDVRVGNMTLKTAEELRRVIKQAQAATDTADAAMASRVLKRWDDFIENLKPADVAGGAGVETVQYLKSARSLWSRARKTEQVEELIERAGTRAGQFTGSGFENALRTEFRQLALNRRKIRLFTKAEQNAIKRVASGTPIDNVFRGLGKLAPTGAVSFGVGAGLGFAAGGAPGAVILPLVGSLSRKIAESRTIKRAEQASEKMRTP